MAQFKFSAAFPGAGFLLVELTVRREAGRKTASLIVKETEQELNIEHWFEPGYGS